MDELVTTYQDIIAGVDEVGRGPLIGDVVTAAVVLTDDCDLALMDSKKLSEKKLAYFYDLIIEQAVDYKIARATAEEIDQLNILSATMLAMQRAVNGLSEKVDKVLVDGNRCPDIDYPCEAIIKGDGKVLAISAASILAKVTRDNEMRELDKQYPEYGFAKHKGYPTKFHLEQMDQFGLIPGYRQSYKPVKDRS
jgi:ribonuclease HII